MITERSPISRALEVARARHLGLEADVAPVVLVEEALELALVQTLRWCRRETGCGWCLRAPSAPGSERRSTVFMSLLHRPSIAPGRLCVERVGVDARGVDASAPHQRAGGLDHRRRAAKIRAPAVQAAQIALDRLGDEAAAMLRAGRRPTRHHVHLERRMAALQLGEPLCAVGVARRAHAEVQVQRVAHAGGDRAAHDRQDRRQPGATGHAQHRAVVPCGAGRPCRAAR